MLLAAPPAFLVLAAMAGDKELRFDRNFSRDRFAFRNPQRRRDAQVQEIENAVCHTGDVFPVAAQWRWQADPKGRDFLVPSEFLAETANMHFIREVLTAVTTLYYQQRPPDGVIRTSFREIATMLGIAVNGQRVEEIWRALEFLRAFTICRQEVITALTASGRLKAREYLTFGFVSYVSVVAMENCREIPETRRKVKICISETYRAVLDLLPPAVIPIAVLEACRRLPRKLVVHAKNLVYALAAERRKPARWRAETVAEIADMRDRPGRRHVSVNNLLRRMEDAGIISYTCENADGNDTVFCIAFQNSQNS